MRRATLVFLSAGLFCSGILSAQEKFEKESRIKSSEVPAMAQAFIDSMHVERRIRWYKEESLTGYTIEAKFKRNRTRYSVEFDSLGTIEDIEVEIKWKTIDRTTQERITAQLNNECLSHKIHKVQRQYTGSARALLRKMEQATSDEPVTIRYEIVCKCKQTDEILLMEYLFSDQGDLITKSKIIFKNTSHLEY